MATQAVQLLTAATGTGAGASFAWDGGDFWIFAWKTADLGDVSFTLEISPNGGTTWFPFPGNLPANPLLTTTAGFMQYVASVAPAANIPLQRIPLPPCHFRVNVSANPGNDPVNVLIASALSEFEVISQPR